MFLAAGIPNGWKNEGEGAAATMYDAGILLEPQLVSLSANEGSSAGGVLYATIIAAGVNDDYTLVNGNDDICVSSRMIAYSLLECVVKATEIETAVSLSVKDNASGATYSCGNAASPTSCNYMTVTASTAPTMEEFTSSVDTLTITGSNFNQAECQVSILGVQADSCSVDSVT